MVYLTTRKDALAAGDRYYANGKPCPTGHVELRNTKTGVCVVCRKEATRLWNSKQPKALFAGYAAKYREANREVVLEKDREYKQLLRDTQPEKIRSIKRASYAKPILAAGGKVQERWAKTSEIEVFAKASEIHKGQYTYVPGTYSGMHKNIGVVCPEHGGFFQSAHAHLKGAVGCTKCNHMKSAPEDAVAEMLEAHTKVIRRDRTMVSPKELDIYLPEKKLAIEYCGEYFHSSGDADSEPKMAEKHILKHKLCAEKGIRLITVFGSEWLEHNYAVRRLLRNAAGAGKGKLMARKCELRRVEHKDAVAFYERYHPQGGAGNGEHFGLYHTDKLVACMRFTLGSNDRGASRTRTWTLSRYATRVSVQGGASRLLKAFVSEKNPKTIKSFSDNRYFGGGMYTQLGFVLDEETAADYQVWHPKLGLMPKAAWQRRNIVSLAKRLGFEIGFDHETDPRTERDMTYLLGGRRIYDCGKKRWTWTNKPLTPNQN